MNNLLLRELPLNATIRLWDTYLSEPDGFNKFHLYVCAAFLCRWKQELESKKDFQSILLFIQNVPTAKWNDKVGQSWTTDRENIIGIFIVGHQPSGGGGLQAQVYVCRRTKPFNRMQN